MVYRTGGQETATTTAHMNMGQTSQIWDRMDETEQFSE
jgi:hypothetical protein